MVLLILALTVVVSASFWFISSLIVTITDFKDRPLHNTAIIIASTIALAICVFVSICGFQQINDFKNTSVEQRSVDNARYKLKLKAQILEDMKNEN